MNTFYLLLITLTIFLSACGDSAPNQDTPAGEAPANRVVNESGETPVNEATNTVAEIAPTAQAVVNKVATDLTKEQKVIDDAVGTINENIGQYSKKKSTMSYKGSEYNLLKYMDENGFVVKVEATGGKRNWEFFAAPKAASPNQLIYSTYYQKTDNPYEPITRSIYHLGSLTDLEPKSTWFLDQEGATVEEAPLLQDEQEYKEALQTFFLN